MERALNGVRRLTEHNPDNRIPASLQARVLDLCKALDGLLQQWERSRGSLSLQDSFHARHIAIRYLPGSAEHLPVDPGGLRHRPCAGERQDGAGNLQGHRRRARSQGCASSATTWPSQDAHAFLVHSKFLKQKFGEAAALPGLALEAESPALNLPQSAALPAGAPPAKES
ncbi:MAG: hypothetical protein IPP44_10635 [Ideonella sp.]|nr:hypothetical protein [Ideonella sp.]